MLRIFITIATLISLSVPANADIYKCRLPDGKTEISNIPCPTGSGTVTARPDERVSEAARRAAEQDVARMRSYVEKREAVQRAEVAAEREARPASQPSTSSASRPQPQSGNSEECLRNVAQMVLETSQRAQMEADCRNIASPPPVYVPVPVAVPAYPQPHHHHPQSEPEPKTKPKAEPPSAPTISVLPLKK
jgi:hypothetical protein